MIRNEEVSVLNESCRNSRMAVEAINTVLNKVYDEELAYDLNLQANKYREFQRKAEKKLREQGRKPKEEKAVSKAMLWTGIQVNTLLNTSTSHVADMVIQGRAKGITELMKVTHNNKNAGSYANELANELMDFEEKNIEKLKRYL
ncbi:hypothetical protein LQZ18_09135 [Lachnospiraceae bacterium ZAX-1]